MGALEMDKLDLCNIEVPDWMRPKNLRKMKDWEVNNNRFGEIPEHYIEIAFSFLFQSRTFAENRDYTATLTLLRELVDARRFKIMQGHGFLHRCERREEGRRHRQTAYDARGHR